MKFFVIAICIMFMAVPAFAVELNFAWDEVTTNADGTPCDDLGGYFFYCSLAAGDYTDPLCKIDVGNEITATVEVALDEGQTGYFVVTAYDLNGNESQPSNEVSHTHPFQCPAAPASLRLVP